MHVLILGGTRFFGIHLVYNLLDEGHQVTIATRGRTVDTFGDRVKRLIVERTNPESLQQQLGDKYFDVICDNLAYCSNDVKYLLDSAHFGRYVMTSSASVYCNRLDTIEADFNPLTYPLKWCNRSDYPYDEIKKQSECALFQAYPNTQAVTVRYPYVIGEDDYTRRFYFYIEHVVKHIPMHVDNLDEPLGFIRSVDAGAFLAWLAEQSCTGPMNGANTSAISLGEVIDYTERKANERAVITSDGEPSPYNGNTAFSLSTARARSLGYQFSTVQSWIYPLIDCLVERAIND